MAQATLEKTKPMNPDVWQDRGGWTDLDNEGWKRCGRMNVVKKSGEVIGRVLGLFLGNNFSPPISRVSEEFPHIPY